MASSRKRICVIGAGVIGTSTAYRLQESVPDTDITIVADQFSPNTTGDGSAGFIRPYFVQGTPDEIVVKWAKETFEHLLALSLTAEGGVLGILLATGYDLFRHHQPEAFWKDTVFGYRALSEAELRQYGSEYRCGYAYTTMMVDCKAYLPWLMNKFLSRGGRRVQMKVDNIASIADDYDVIVNCTGVGARHLVNDADVRPVKGQLIKVRAPWVKHFVNAEDDDLYILVGATCVALGGTHDEGVWSREIDEKQRERIWQGCCRLVPSLVKSEVIEDWAGFRPGRSSVRLETQDMNVGGGRKAKVVHCYGHGGSGVTLHWGCAADTVRLIQRVLNSSLPAARM